MKLNPSVVVQSAMALTLAVTTSDFIKTSIEAAASNAPHNTIKYKFLAIILVIILIYICIFIIFEPTSKYNKDIPIMLPLNRNGQSYLPTGV